MAPTSTSAAPGASNALQTVSGQGSVFDDLAQRLEQVVDTERHGIRRRLGEEDDETDGEGTPQEAETPPTGEAPEGAEGRQGAPSPQPSPMGRGSSQGSSAGSRGQ